MLSLSFLRKFLSTLPNVSMCLYKGVGKSQRKRWDKPFSVLAGMLIRARATPGCVNPTTVRLVEDMEKFASPLTVKKKLL